jgi:hypothetical protein
MGLAGFAIGTVAGQFAGAWAYGRIRGGGPEPAPHEVLAAVAAGLTTTLVSSVVYVPLGVHIWLAGEHTSWGASVFIALCMGICQAVLFKGRPLARRSTPSR